MAGVVDVRGSGSARAQRPLARLEEHPEQLDGQRRVFGDSPPLYESDMLRTATRFWEEARFRGPNPNPPTEEQRLREERRMQLEGEREASEPHRQFSAQVEEERKRIWYTDPRTNWREMELLDLFTFEEEARETVKQRWIEQGIWNNKWNYYAIGRWKHEEPLELESESETDTEAESSRPIFSLFSQPKPRRPKREEEKRLIAERRVVREREREASRPYYQFVYQVSKERERIQEESANSADAADINTRAYEIIKNTWTKRGIWKTRWGILPGMSWKHEEPLEEETADETARRNAQPSVDHEAANLVFPPLFGPRAVTTTSQQGPPADIDSAGLENAQPQLVASASLDPAHLSKVSKAAGKRKEPQQQLNTSQKVSSDSLPLSSGIDAAEPQPSPSPDRVAPRRSKRTHLTRTASTNPSKRAVRSKPVASSLTARSSAKPQAKSKKQPAQITRGRARKK